MIFIIEQTSEFNKPLSIVAAYGFWEEHALDNYKFNIKIKEKDKIKVHKFPEETQPGDKVHLYIELDEYYSLKNISTTKISPLPYHHIYELYLEDEGIGITPIFISKTLKERQ